MMRSAALVIVTALVITGCSTAIDPFSDRAGQVFAVHGYVTMADSVQRIRVERLRETVLSDGPSLDGVVVRSLHEDTGQRQAWRPAGDPSDGAAGYIFEASFTPVAGTYRLEVLDRDGQVSLTARTTLHGPPRYRYGTALVNGQNVSVPVTLLGVTSQPDLLGFGYTVRPTDNDSLQTRFIGYGKAGMVRGDGWEFTIFLTIDRRTLLRQLGRDPDLDRLYLESMTLRTRMATEDWSLPAGRNIDGGYGFFGGVSQYDQPIRFEDTMLLDAGFVLTP